MLCNIYKFVYSIVLIIIEVNQYTVNVNIIELNTKLSNVY